jgi:hypothetical protein
MRAKLLALRSGRILSAEEVSRLAIEANISSNPMPDTSVPPEEKEEPEEEDEDVNEEDVVSERELNAHVNTLMQNLMPQPEEHQSKSHRHVSDIVTKLRGPGQPRLQAALEYENIYGDDEGDE